MIDIRVTVVIPLYNKGNLVVETIRSVLRGTLAPFEILVIDDGSTDSGPALVEAMNEPLVKVFHQANAGVSAARNRGIEIASGDFVAFLDADDLWQENFLFSMQALVNKFSGCSLYASGYQLLMPDGKSQRLRVTGEALCDEPSLIQRFYETRARATFFITSSVVVPRKVLIERGIRFPLGERLGEDQDVWFRLAECGAVAYEPRPLMLYRQAVVDSLSTTPLGFDLLPFVQRLKHRYEAQQVPTLHRSGIRSLLAREQVGVAMRRYKAGRVSDARSMIANSLTLWAGHYGLRALIQIYFGHWFFRPRND